MFDVGGRRLHIVCEGPRGSAQPTVIFESGAFGFSADWAIVQAKLSESGVRSCAYDRAGLGYSDPGPQPRDGMSVARDLEKLLQVAGEPGPYILVSHSMAGLHVRLFADRNPGLVAGLVLVDSTTPEAMDDSTTRRYVSRFTTGARAAAVAASFGIMRTLKSAPFANKIGLTAEPEAEKRQMFASARSNRVAAQEVEQWPTDARQARRSGSLRSEWPVAVVIAGTVHGPMRDVQYAPARGAQHGYVEVVQGATHDNLLGPKYADAIIRGVAFVIRFAVRSAAHGQAASA
jgi:pimeloyl-ACP methyl ester carboxylesterase